MSGVLCGVRREPSRDNTLPNPANPLITNIGNLPRAEVIRVCGRPYSASRRRALELSVTDSLRTPDRNRSVGARV